MKLSEIRKAIGAIADVTGEDDLEIRYLLTDSRELEGVRVTGDGLRVTGFQSKVESRNVTEPVESCQSKAEHTLFFAIKTDKDDGAKYIPELREKGVRAFVTGDSIAALQALAAYVRAQFKGTVIGITGSNGKTVVKEWLYQLLKDDYDIIRSPKSYNSQIGVPLSVWLLANADRSADCKTASLKDRFTERPAAPAGDKPCLAIFEAGISQPGEMEKLEPMIRPDIGVITYIGHEHDENFSSLEQKREEKMKLFVHSEQVIEDPTHQNVRTCAAVMRALGYDEEVIAERILRQTHETVLKVNLSALVGNVRYFRSLLKPETKLTCMVKAFAYGAGSVEVSRALQEAEGLRVTGDGLRVVDYLAVAVADEGVELRKAGITLPIIIMDPEVAAMDLILENNLEPNVYSHQSLKTVIAAAEAKGLENVPIHIKIDSGMHRLGFYKEDIPWLIDKLQQTKAVRVASVFSHLAGSDEAQFDDFTLQQIRYFDECAEELKKGLSDQVPGTTVIKHICNSAGIERFTDYQFDMCRLGIGLYGFSFAGAKLRNVCSLETTILSVKTVKAGETIGYGRHTKLDEDRVIAVIPIGYADGFDRRFSNYGGEVYIRGKRCPVVGNVCMDQAMIDVTGTDARPGDPVEIFGEHVTLQELADKLGTITYEILTSVSRRVQRLYFYE
ncbi:MAG: alanine racemase [Paludibacteraceae bacterium]|nr:alanine racemase [Paludibacteraceae bacterium]MBQ8705208.1 alanine racemase [Paludibacteraceae bacterium]